MDHCGEVHGVVLAHKCSSQYRLYRAVDEDSEVHNRSTLGYSEFRLKVVFATGLSASSPICESTTLYDGVVLDS